jgi:alanine racemase
MAVFGEVIALDDGLAVLDLGSADGIPPSVLGPSGSGAEVLLGGSRAAVTAVDIDTLRVAIPEGVPVSIGDEVMIFGTGDSGEPTAEDWATWAGTIGDEIVVRASRRIPRTFLGSGVVG